MIPADMLTCTVLPCESAGLNSRGGSVLVMWCHAERTSVPPPAHHGPRRASPRRRSVYTECRTCCRGGRSSAEGRRILLCEYVVACGGSRTRPHLAGRQHRSVMVHTYHSSIYTRPAASGFSPQRRDVPRELSPCVRVGERDSGNDDAVEGDHGV